MPVPPTLYHGGRILTEAWAGPDLPDALLVRDGKVAWIGTASAAPAAHRRVDLGGRLVLPGLTDAHTHVFLEAMSRVQLRTGDAASVADLLDRVADAARRQADSGWVISSDYNEFVLAEQRHLTRAELDHVTPDTPVLLRRTGGHLAVANSAALRLAGITEDTPDPPGGSFDRAEGRMTGILRESAEALVVAVAPPPEAAAMARAIGEVSRDYLSLGVIAAVDAATGFSCGFGTEWTILQQARDAGQMPLRMGFMPDLTATTAAAQGLTRPEPDPHWQVIGLKWFVDGILGARTAYLTERYADTEGTGMLMQPAEALRAELISAHEAGWQIATHAIGDAAITLVLDSIEEALARAPRVDPRHRIEHLGIATPTIRDRLAELGVVVVPQYGFLPRLGRSFEAAVGRARMDLAYPGRGLLDRGVRVAGSSDTPIGPMSPFVGMAGAVTRSDDAGTVYSADERMTLDEAIGLYTQGGALAMRHEGFRGRLAPGMAADLAVLDNDITRLPPDRIAGTSSVLTLIDGRVAHDAGALDPAGAAAP